MAPQRGFDGKARVNGQVYSVAEWEADEEAPPALVSNTEGIPASALGQAAGNVPGTEAKVADVARLRIRLVNASFDPAANMFQAPIALASGQYYHVQLYPAGLLGVQWNMISGYCESVSHAGRVPGLQPVTAQFSSDGNWVRPSV